MQVEVLARANLVGDEGLLIRKRKISSKGKGLFSRERERERIESTFKTGAWLLMAT